MVDERALESRQTAKTGGASIFPPDSSVGGDAILEFNYKDVANMSWVTYDENIKNFSIALFYVNPNVNAWSQSESNQ